MDTENQSDWEFLQDIDFLKVITLPLSEDNAVELSVGTELCSDPDGCWAQISTIHAETVIPSVFCPEKMCAHSFYNHILSTTVQGFDKRVKINHE